MTAMYLKTLDSISQVLQIIGVLLSAPGLWIEHWGIQLERYAYLKYIHRDAETRRTNEQNARPTGEEK